MDGVRGGGGHTDLGCSGVVREGTVVKVWLTTDTHFYHSMLIEKGHRPPTYNEQIIYHWRRMVQPGDMVIHLGDVMFGKRVLLKSLIESLPGIKTLIRGNHDSESCMWYCRNGFSMACDGLLYQHVWFTHRPSKHLPEDAWINVHGHMHDNKHRVEDDPVFKHNRLLALEYTGYMPVEFQKFMDGKVGVPQ